MAGRAGKTGSGEAVSSRRRKCPAVRPPAPAGAQESPGRLRAASGEPFDLDGFLGELNDDKLRQLREGVEREVRRRGWAGDTPNADGEAKPSPPRRRTDRRRPERGKRSPRGERPSRVQSALTFGQERLVRAALAAGAKPAAIAKELGVARNHLARIAKTMKAGRPAG